MILCAVISVTTNVRANRMAEISAGGMTRQLRHDLFEKITYLSARQMNEFTVSSAVSRLTSDTYNVNRMMARMQRLGGPGADPPGRRYSDHGDDGTEAGVGTDRFAAFYHCDRVDRHEAEHSRVYRAAESAGRAGAGSAGEYHRCAGDQSAFPDRL